MFQLDARVGWRGTTVFTTLIIPFSCYCTCGNNFQNMQSFVKSQTLQGLHFYQVILNPWRRAHLPNISRRWVCVLMCFEAHSRPQLLRIILIDKQWTTTSSILRATDTSMSNASKNVIYNSLFKGKALIEYTKTNLIPKTHNSTANLWVFNVIEHHFYSNIAL